MRSMTEGVPKIPQENVKNPFSQGLRDHRASENKGRAPMPCLAALTSDALYSARFPLLRRFAPILRRIDDPAALDADLRIVVEQGVADPYQLPPQRVGQP